MTAQQAGGEPLLMARRNLCPVWVGKDRAAAARAALQAHPQCDVVLCDDGLQHYRLQRDVEIAVIDGERGLGTRWPRRRGGWAVAGGRPPARPVGGAGLATANGGCGGS